MRVKNGSPQLTETILLILAIVERFLRKCTVDLLITGKRS